MADSDIKTPVSEVDEAIKKADELREEKEREEELQRKIDEAEQQKLDELIDEAEEEKLEEKIDEAEEEKLEEKIDEVEEDSLDDKSEYDREDEYNVVPGVNKLEGEKLKRNIETARKLTEEQKQKTEAKNTKKKKKGVRKILRYYDSSMLIPVTRSNLIPGNYYVFKYSNYDHVPTPLILYIGSNHKYKTMDGISLQYFGVGTRFDIEKKLGDMNLHNERAQKAGKQIKNLLNEEQHIFRSSYTSNSIYSFIKRVMKGNFYYRRFKFWKISGRIYVVPMEQIKNVLAINTVVYKGWEKTKKVKTDKKKFDTFLDKAKRFLSGKKR